MQFKPQGYFLLIKLCPSETFLKCFFFSNWDLLNRKSTPFRSSFVLCDIFTDSLFYSWPFHYLMQWDGTQIIHPIYLNVLKSRFGCEKYNESTHSPYVLLILFSWFFQPSRNCHVFLIMIVLTMSITRICDF